MPEKSTLRRSKDRPQSTCRKNLPSGGPKIGLRAMKLGLSSSPDETRGSGHWPKPDISTVETFERAMLEAKSIAYLKAGTSGPYLERLFETFGIAAELRSKAKRTETDTVGELIAEGEAEVGVTAIATLIATPGIEIVGQIPQEIQSYVSFQAAVSTNAVSPEIANELIRFVTGPTALPIIRSKGMEPW